MKRQMWSVVVVLAWMALVMHAEEISFLHVDTKEVDSSEAGVAPGNATTSCSCGIANKALGRIVGGKETSPHEYPWTAALKDKHTPFQFCGAAILTPYHALTGAHCTWRRRVEGDPIVLVVGQHNIGDGDERKEVDIVRIIEHEQFNRVTLANDLAVVVLGESLAMSAAVGVVCLPTPTSLPPLDHRYVKILGWGQTSHSGDSSDVLLGVNARVVPIKPCSYSYPGRVRADAQNHLCTYRRNKGSCQGDSGGPVVYLDQFTNRYTLVGVVSFGGKCASTTPTVNTRVSHYLPWIHNKIKESHPEVHPCHRVD